MVICAISQIKYRIGTHIFQSITSVMYYKYMLCTS